MDVLENAYSKSNGIGRTHVRKDYLPTTQTVRKARSRTVPKLGHCEDRSRKKQKDAVRAALKVRRTK